MQDSSGNGVVFDLYCASLRNRLQVKNGCTTAIGEIQRIYSILSNIHFLTPNMVGLEFDISKYPFPKSHRQQRRDTQQNVETSQYFFARASRKMHRE